MHALGLETSAALWCKWNRAEAHHTFCHERKLVDLKQNDPDLPLDSKLPVRVRCTVQFFVSWPETATELSRAFIQEKCHYWEETRKMERLCQSGCETIYYGTLTLRTCSPSIHPSRCSAQSRAGDRDGRVLPCVRGRFKFPCLLLSLRLGNPPAHRSWANSIFTASVQIFGDQSISSSFPHCS